MIGWLSYVVIGIAVVAAIWGGVSAITRKPPGNLQFYWSFLAELAVIAQSVIGFVAIGRGHGPAETATAIGYLIGIVVLMPVGIWWAVVDRSRYSGLVMTVAGVAIAVMSLRLLQLWSVASG
ncbi:hypothetical protein [Microlunatus soli]|uniref:Integral membrane protein n=1 Tax=Microlunatus soli TaxID=630515 RepID=A0A1H1QUM0_9ACTN|nr:hypothetical protein [Microlunatus soli]SDS27087.1 hypothetical protein SAMN04489812_1396 [Microlunatus soli]